MYYICILIPIRPLITRPKIRTAAKYPDLGEITNPVDPSTVPGFLLNIWNINNNIVYLWSYQHPN